MTEAKVAAHHQFRRLLKNSSMMFVLNVMSAAVGFLTIPVTLRVMGLEHYGQLVLIQAIAASVFVLTTVQYWQGMLVELPGRALGAHELRSETWHSVKFECVGLTCAVLSCLGLGWAGMRQLAGFDAVTISMLAVAAVLPVSGTLTAYFRLTERYGTLMQVGLGANLLRLAAVYAVAQLAPSIFNVGLAYMVPEVLRCLALFGIIATAPSQLSGELSASTIDRVRMRRSGMWSAAQAMTDLPVAQLDKVILGLVLSGEGLGVFNILKRIYGVLNMATAPFYTTSIPEFAGFVNSGKLDQAFMLWAKTMRLLLLLVGTIALACFATKGLWMPFLFRELNSYVVEFVVVLVTAVVAGTFITTHAFYWATGRQRQATVITAATNTFYLLLLWLLTDRWALVGSMVAFLIHVSLAAAIKIFLLQRLRAAMP